MDVNPGSRYLSRPFCWFKSVFFIKPLKNRSKTAQILLEKPFKNHRKKWAVSERFFKQDLSGLSGFSKKKPPKPPKPHEPLKSCWKTAQTAHSWAVFERDLDPGGLMQCSSMQLHSHDNNWNKLKTAADKWRAYDSRITLSAWMCVDDRIDLMTFMPHLDGSIWL